MSKFKVGDKVRIISGIMRYRGLIGEITEIKFACPAVGVQASYYRLDISDSYTSWYDHNLELIRSDPEYYYITYRQFLSLIDKVNKESGFEITRRAFEAPGSYPGFTPDQVYELVDILSNGDYEEFIVELFPGLYELKTTTVLQRKSK